MSESALKQATDSSLPPEDRAAARRLGRAIKVLRARADVTAEGAGRRIGMTGAGWLNYEHGRAPGIFRPSVQQRLAEALGFTAADLLQERDRLADAATP